ncbi:methyltransferase family protein [Salana multivorans]|uniref:Methyltransferase family protein n=1 Tax=Salana multivorans TaxID=120377 RepID=A0A3N2DCL5_9MICO|nr:class I SAM-dependent methyltransferase [Salana multivorans]ROR97452.1 methyltransferase family protein [Salana multivorans]
MKNDPALPLADRRPEDVPGHWLLARLGKRVLRPGGLETTDWLLRHADLPGRDVVELAPGLGRTARDILAAGPASYVGVDADPAAVATVEGVVGERGRCVLAQAQATGLPDASADVVVGEAMLSMQGERGKREIVAEAARVLRPGGRYVVHELGLVPDDLDGGRKEELRKALARSIKVNARPLTVAEWRELLESAGLEVEATTTAPMALLEVRRNVADEGLGGVLRIVWNVLRQPDARRRVLAMRRVFRENRDVLVGVGLVARRPEQPAPENDDERDLP